MRLACVALFLALASSANAKDIVLPLNEREQVVLRELLNIAVKAGGLEVASTAIYFTTKMQQQQNAEQSVPPVPPAEPPK